VGRMNPNTLTKQHIQATKALSVITHLALVSTAHSMCDDNDDSNDEMMTVIQALSHIP